MIRWCIMNPVFYMHLGNFLSYHLTILLKLWLICGEGLSSWHYWPSVPPFLFKELNCTLIYQGATRDEAKHKHRKGGGSYDGLNMEWAPLGILHCHGGCGEKGYFTVSAQNRLLILFYSVQYLFHQDAGGGSRNSWKLAVNNLYQSIRFSLI